MATLKTKDPKNKNTNITNVLVSWLVILLKSNAMKTRYNHHETETIHLRAFI